jgi:hypothetical protein
VVLQTVISGGGRLLALHDPGAFLHRAGFKLQMCAIRSKRLPGNPQLRAAFFQNESGIPEAKVRAMIASIMLAAAGWSAALSTDGRWTWRCAVDFHRLENVRQVNRGAAR